MEQRCKTTYTLIFAAFTVHINHSSFNIKCAVGGTSLNNGSEIEIIYTSVKHSAIHRKGTDYLELI